jgi:hypothetical protein
MQHSQLMPQGDVLEADGGGADTQGAKVGPDTEDEDHRRLQGHEVTTRPELYPEKSPCPRSTSAEWNLMTGTILATNSNFVRCSTGRSEGFGTLEGLIEIDVGSYR